MAVLTVTNFYANGHATMVFCNFSRMFKKFSRAVSLLLIPCECPANDSLVEVASYSNTSNGCRLGVEWVVWKSYDILTRLYGTLVGILWESCESLLNVAWGSMRCRTGLAGPSHASPIRLRRDSGAPKNNPTRLPLDSHETPTRPRSYTTAAQPLWTFQSGRVGIRIWPTFADFHTISS